MRLLCFSLDLSPVKSVLYGTDITERMVDSICSRVFFLICENSFNILHLVYFYILF